MFDLHVHSSFSPDASATMEEAVISALDKGLKELCFTDHIDYDYPDMDIHFNLKYDLYFDTIEKLQEKYKDKILIRKGIEMGLQPHVLEKCRKDIEKHNFDFVIGSVHVVEKKDLYNSDYFDNRTQKESYELYFEELHYMISHYQEYNVLGHLDIIKRYGGFNTPLPLEEFKGHVISILKKIIADGKGIELNTSGFRYNLGDYHPSLDILKIYYQLGGEIITLGSDAHWPGDIAFAFDNAIRDLHDLGFKYICSFDKMKPIFHKITTLL